MRNILSQIQRVLVALWASIANLAEDVIEEVAGVIIVNYMIVASFSILTIIMLLTGSTEFAFAVAFAASIIIILRYAASEFVLRAMFTISNALLGRRKIVGTIAQGIHNVLNPLILISVIFSFISCVAIINGIEFFTFKVLMIIIAVGFFFFILSTFVFKYRGRRLEFWMAMIVVWLLFENIILPNQIRPLTSFGRSLSEKVSTSVNQSGQNNSLKTIKAGATLYSEDFRALRKINADITVKFLSFESFSKTKEDFNKVILPDNNGDYLRGEVVLVPVRYIENYQQVNSEPKQEKETGAYVKPIGKNKVLVHFTPNCVIGTGLYKTIGDEVNYINPTSQFKVEGFSQPYYLVSTTMPFTVKTDGEIKIYGDGTNYGEVVVELIKLSKKNRS